MVKNGHIVQKQYITCLVVIPVPRHTHYRESEEEMCGVAIRLESGFAWGGEGLRGLSDAQTTRNSQSGPNFCGSGTYLNLYHGSNIWVHIIKLIFY